MITLESKLYKYLGIPVEQTSTPTRGIDESLEAIAADAVRELRRELFELRKEASQIGRIPLHYPSHVVVVMKAVSALLPWYTRPLAHFAQRASRTADLTSKLLEEMLQNHELLAREVAELKHQAGRPSHQ